MFHQFVTESLEFISYERNEATHIKAGFHSTRAIQAIDHSFYGFTGAINHAGCWENTRIACKSQVFRRMIHKLFECSLSYEITMEKVCQ